MTLQQLIPRPNILSLWPTAAGQKGMRQPHRQLGFTLIELLLSLSIVSVMLVVILGALRVGVRAWEKGEHMLVVQQRSRTVLDHLTRQLTSATVLMSAQGSAPLVAFAGNNRSIEFTSSLPLVSKKQFGPVVVKYVIETEPGGEKQLLLFERNVTTDDYLAERPLKSGTEAHILIEALENFRFEYLIDDGNGSHLNWTAAWQPRHPTDLPRAVRMIYRSEKGRPDVQVIARMYRRASMEEEM